MIEHDPEVLCSLQQILQAEGYSVLIAASVQEGLRLPCGMHRPRAINLQIPEMGGLELIRQFHLIRLTTKIIDITGYQENEQYLAVNSYLGDHMMLQKPFSRQTPPGSGPKATGVMTTGKNGGGRSQGKAASRQPAPKARCSAQQTKPGLIKERISQG